ncbi:MAG: nuclear transport factor 2 family protein [Pseudomonadota bacterium]|nr:nuclear transport factor 2 family protein [Pseudomonadota bacterium]
MSNENNVADRIALQDVMLKYAAGVDERDFDLYASCFLENVEVVDFGEDPINGRDEWVEYVKGALNNYGPTQHMLGPQLATIDGDNAHCRTDVQALHYLKQPEGEILTLWATYETDMVRTDEGWKISKHRLVSRGIRQQ